MFRLKLLLSCASQVFLEGTQKKKSALRGAEATPGGGASALRDITGGGVQIWQFHHTLSDRRGGK